MTQKYATPLEKKKKKKKKDQQAEATEVTLTCTTLRAVALVNAQHWIGQKKTALLALLFTYVFFS